MGPRRPGAGIDGLRRHRAFVSHDRYFVNRLADHLIIFEPGGVRVIEGNYDAYQLFLQSKAAAAPPSPKQVAMRRNGDGERGRNGDGEQGGKREREKGEKHASGTATAAKEASSEGPRTAVQPSGRRNGNFPTASSPTLRTTSSSERHGSSNLTRSWGSGHVPRRRPRAFLEAGAGGTAVGSQEALRALG